MLYDNYQKRIQRIADVLSAIVKRIPLIVCAVSVIIAATVALLSCVGNTGEVRMPEEIEYGDDYEFEARAFGSGVRIEYRAADSEEWSETKPHVPGEYSARAVGRSVFNKDRYGKEYSFSILPRKVDVRVKDASVVYGELPEATAETVYGDIFISGGVFVENPFAEKTNVTPCASGIRFIDKDGNDVSYAYNVNIVSSEFSFDKRKISVTVGSASKEYDGTPLTLEAYEITSGTLAESDSLGAIFNSLATDAGNVENIPEFRILHNENGELTDVTERYDIAVASGELSVTKKVVVFKTGSLEAQYTAEGHSCPDFEIDPEYKLLEGHTAYLDSCPSFTNSGEYGNSLVIGIVDQHGVDKTANYAIYYDEGVISISQRKLYITTLSVTRTYDGYTYRNNNFIVTGLLANHRARANKDSIKIETIGIVENKFTVSVYDFKSNNVTANYDIEYEYGIIETLPIEITIRTGDAKIVYDGAPHSFKEFELTRHALAKPDSLVIESSSKITEVGSTENVFETYKILSSSGEDRTECYIITFEYGTLEITPRQIVVKPDDTEKLYDSTPLYAGEVKLSELSHYELVPGHRIEAQALGSRTNAGVSNSTVGDIEIYDGERNVTQNYDIVALEGEIKVTERKLIVATASSEKYYDGTPLTAKEYSVSALSPHPLLIGHDLSVDVTGSRTRIGESRNTVNKSRTRITAEGVDVTSNYDIYYDLGYLKVNSYAMITVVTSGAVKYYDGMPLTNGEYDIYVNSGSLKEGHSVVVTVTGTITNPGSVPNRAELKVVDASGKDVSPAYERIVSTGTLRVIDKNNSNIKDDTVFGRIKSDRSEVVYLRIDSYGDYTGRGWSGAIPYDKVLPGGYSYNYLTSVALQNSGAVATNVEIVDSTLYMLPYYMGFTGDYTVPRIDTVYNGSMSEYSLSYYNIPTGRNGYESLKGNLGEYEKYEEEYRKFVYENYLRIDDATRSYMKDLIVSNGFSISDPNVIHKVASFIQRSAVYNLNYSPSLDMEENVAVAFLKEYKEGVCVHYASAATLMYRALGIPARYVTGFMIKTVKNTFMDISNPGHAWVEVYVDGVGWIKVEVTGASSSSSSSGDLSVDLSEPVIIELTPAYQWQVYSGKPLEAENKLDINGILADLLKEGYTYSVSVTGSCTDVGRGVSKITGFKLYDKQGNDVTENYLYVYKEGVLEVFDPNKTVIKVTLHSIQKFYDGNALPFIHGDYDIVNEPRGAKVFVTIRASLVDAGEITLSQMNVGREEYASWHVIENSRDVSSKYVVVFEAPKEAPEYYIPLRIDKRIISLASATESKIEDGTPLRNETVVISKGSLVLGHTIDAYAVGYIDHVGTVKNEINYSNIVIRDKSGNDVTDNYAIMHCTIGELTIISMND